MEFTYSQVESLNETETYVYNYVVKNTKKVLNESIRVLANNTHVSTATVMRFCKKMGCEGFTELKYRLKEIEEVQETDQEEKNDFYDYIEYIKSKEYLDSIKKTADIIKRSDLLVMLGFGIHSDFANHAARSFCRSGYYCYAIDNDCYPVVEVAEKQNPVIVFVYEKSQEKSLFEIMHQYKSCHYTIIMIANENIGILSNLCDDVIYVSKGDVRMGQVVSAVPLLYAIERIIYELTK